MTIYTRAGIAGSGKTQRLIAYARHRLSLGKKTVFVCPSRALCRQTATRLEALGVAAADITMIHGERGSTASVGLRLQEHLRQRDVLIARILRHIVRVQKTVARIQADDTARDHERQQSQC